MRNVESWRALYRCEDLQKARLVATCLSAMEYEVRLFSLAGQIFDRPGESSDESRLTLPPFEVQVPATDWPQLVDVLEEIIDEQEQFDELVESVEHRVSRAEKRLLVAMIVVVSALAVAGAIEL